MMMLLIALMVLGSSSANKFAELCNKWNRQAVEIRCRNGLYYAYCGRGFTRNCANNAQSEILEDHREEVINRRPFNPNMRCTSQDRVRICEKWIKQGDYSFCTTNPAMVRKYCCNMGKKRCRDIRKPIETPEDDLSPTQAPQPSRQQQTERPRRPQAQVPSPAENYRACCQANGVPPECLKICTYNPRGSELCNAKENCESYFYHANYCGNNNQNNIPCCKSVGVSPICYKFCDANSQFIDVSNVQQLSSHRPCLENGGKPRQCAVNNYKGPNWQRKSIPRQGKFPTIVKQVVANLGACKRG